jgi:hypothetical protein
MWMSPSPSIVPASGAGAVAAVGPGGLAPMAGGSPEADDEPPSNPERADAEPTSNPEPADAEPTWNPEPAKAAPYPEVVLVAVVFGAACIVFGIIPSPLFHLASHAASAIGGIF